MGSMCEMKSTFGNRVVETEFGFEWTGYSTSIYGCLYIPMGLWGTDSCHQEVTHSENDVGPARKAGCGLNQIF